jgi:hypothetical protein
LVRPVIPWSGEPEKGFTRVDSCLTLKNQIRLESLSMDKHYRPYYENSYNTDEKVFLTLGPGTNVIKLFSFITFRCSPIG